MRLVCISAAHTPYYGGLMERSAARVGVEIVRFKQGEPWPKDFRVGKLVHGLECICSLPNNVTHVMFVDSSDSIFLAGPEEIVEKFEAMGRKIWLQGEKNCYPDKNLIAAYPAQRTAWHYVNSGGWICRRDEAEFATMKLVAEGAEYCDQLCWTRRYLLGSDFPMAVDVDENCQIFQSMYLQQPGEFQIVRKRLWNMKTGGRACVAHWNGTRGAAPVGGISRMGLWSTIDIEERAA